MSGLVRKGRYCTKNGRLNRMRCNNFEARALKPAKDMLKSIVWMAFWAVLWLPTKLWAQEELSFPGLWRDHLGFRNARDVFYVDNDVYVATEQGLFVFSDVDFGLQKLTKVNGLNDFDISDIVYNPALNQVVVAYRSGNIDVYDPTANRVTNFSDIRRSTSVFGSKRINQMYAQGDSVFFACDFGIVVLDLRRELFRDTYYIGPEGGQIKVNGVWVDKSLGRIYAATANGLLQANLKSALSFFGNWQSVPQSHQREILHVCTFANRMFYATTTNNDQNDSIYYIENNQRMPLGNQFEGSKRQLSRGQYGLEVVSRFNAALYDENLQVIQNVAVNGQELKEFNPQKVAFNLPGQRFWVADANLGLVRNFDFFYNQLIYPEGPQSNAMFSMSSRGRNLYVAPGGMTDSWLRIFNNDGFFRFDGESNWQHLSSADLGDVRDLVHISVDPKDPEHLFVSSWGSGMLEIQNNTLLNRFTSANTDGAIQSVSGLGNNVFLIGGSAFDNDGNLWMTNGLTNQPLVVKRANGSWASFGLGALAGTNTGVRDIMYTSLGQLWIQTRNNGLVVFEETQNGPRFKGLNALSGSGSLPSLEVLAMAEDQDGEIWVGTNSGLGVIYTPYNIFENGLNYDAQPILIETNEGIVERLLDGQTITDIEVDGANKKWVATASNGVFYFSSDGTEQIHHFTAQNSPLLSNNVVDVEIEDETGFVYLATDRGLVSFKGSATEGGLVFEEVYAYPNPVRPGYEGPIFIKGLVTNAQVKISDLSGNLVFETQAEGGQALWNGRNFRGQRVQSGVYLVFLTNDDGSETQMTKILLVN